MNEFVECAAFIQIEARTRYSDGRPYAVSAVKMTQRRPDFPNPGSVVVAVRLRIPVGAFLPLRPSAVVEIPADFAESIPVEVEAVDATGDESGGDSR